MPLLLSTYVQRRPFAVPIERYAVLALVHIVKLLEVVIFDGPSAIHVEQAKGNLVLRVWFRKEILEGAPVVQIDPAGAAPISHAKEDSILLALDFVLQQDHHQQQHQDDYQLAEPHPCGLHYGGPT